MSNPYLVERIQLAKAKRGHLTREPATEVVVEVAGRPPPLMTAWLDLLPPRLSDGACDDHDLRLDASTAGGRPHMLPLVQRLKEVMGMPVTVNLAGQLAGDAAIDEVFANFELFDVVFSPFIEDSQVSRINRGELLPEHAGELVHQVISMCRQYERATNGYFSAWIGGRFDPSGLVKGWAIDRACSILDRHGYKDYFVDAGGDVQTRGRNPDDRPWRVGVRHPVERDRVACVVLASGAAVATSGTYEKGKHIIDPHTGRPADELLSLTVVGPDIVQADVFATAGFAMGMPGLEFVQRSPGYAAFAIDRQLRAWSTLGFEAFREGPPGVGDGGRAGLGETAIPSDL